jgi:hypothetical protein
MKRTPQVLRFHAFLFPWKAVCRIGFEPQVHYFRFAHQLPLVLALLQFFQDLAELVA